MHTQDPIGVFDSGVGGITILKEIRKLLPFENLVYLADTHFCPYGVKPIADIRVRTLKVADFLVSQRIKALTVACNSACTAGLDQIRDKYPHLPVIGVEPGIKPACEQTKNKKIGIISTSLTLEGPRFARLVERFGDGIDILKMPAPGLVELVEEGALDGAKVEALLHEYLDPLIDAGIDTLILGCTHYPFLIPVIQRLCGPSITIIDTGPAIAKQTRHIVEKGELLNSPPHTSRLDKVLGTPSPPPGESEPPPSPLLRKEGELGEVRFYTSGDVNAEEILIKKLWPEAIEKVNWVTV